MSKLSRDCKNAVDPRADSRRKTMRHGRMLPPAIGRIRSQGNLLDLINDAEASGVFRSLTIHSFQRRFSLLGRHWEYYRPEHVARSIIALECKGIPRLHFGPMSSSRTRRVMSLKIFVHFWSWLSGIIAEPEFFQLETKCRRESPMSQGRAEQQTL